MIANRMEHIAPFHVMEVIRRASELAAQGRSVVHMEVGEPDFPTAQPIVEAGCQALRDGHTGYTESKGILPLREAIAGHYQSRYGVEVDPQRIIVTAGASAALQLATAVMLNPGDEVIMADPSYPCNRHFVRAVDGIPRLIPVTEAQGYQPGPADVAAHWTPRSKALMLASPSNPTGTMIAPSVLADLIATTEQRAGRVLMDEIYHGLCYLPTRESTALEFSDQVFVINSFSKYFGMTGWRLGWLIAPQDYRRAVEKLGQNLFICAPSVSQYAGVAAFTAASCEIAEARRAEFKQRRDFLLPALRELGFSIPLQPEGAFYLYADCSAFLEAGESSYDFAFRVLEQCGVAITPGVDFGAHRADYHVRFSYANSLENLTEGVERLRRFLIA